ncbi:MAG: F0F1 ATP synthase subunit B [Clostridiales Family XIII bacterium]|jgi:F-type H+-transporting ATPase subunit b|nr:F0F1 ATP synthase subunit B [Clostridiales Family XIII bacterium]
MHYAPLIGFNWTLVMVLITFVVLYFVMKKLFFDKVHNFMSAREQKVKDAFDNAEAANKAAEEKLTAYNEQLSAVEEQRRDMLRKAKQDADALSQSLVSDAEEKAAAIVTRANQEIEREKERALVDMREQIGLLAIYAAEKILKAKIDAGEQQGIIDGVIEEAGRAEWKI